MCIRDRAQPVPTILEINATEIIIIKEFDKYRDKLVAIKCGHIFSAGKNAIQIIAAIGNSTSAAIIIENITHRSQLSLYLKFIFLLKFASIFIE